MGRRAQHTPEELRSLIVDAAERIVERGGLAKLSAREIAREIDYAPGTLYNMFTNLDDILFQVEGRLLRGLDVHLENETRGKDGHAKIGSFANAYVDYAHARPKLWSLLFEHQPTDGTPLPEWYVEVMEAPVDRLRAALCTAVGPMEQEALQARAHGMWRMIHSMTLLSTSSKFGRLDKEKIRALVSDLVESCMTGMRAQKAKRPSGGRTSREQAN